MADEEKNETTEETPEETPAAEADAPVADAPESPPEENGEDSESPASASQPGTPGSEAEDVPADDADGEAEAPEAEAAPADDPEEGLDWKTRKRLATSRESGEAAPQRTVEERAAERAKSRAAAIKSRAAYRRKQREKHQTGEGTAPVEHESAGRKERQGRVVSDKANKTITVRIDVARRHPTYEKIVRTSNTLHAHDESNEAGEGDLVKIVETRPLSKTKRWRLVEIMEKAK